MMKYLHISTDVRNKTLHITISRESKLNALNKLTLAELHESLSSAIVNKDIGGIIITGAGQLSFVAGADIAELADFNLGEGQELVRLGHLVFDLIANSPKPVIAAINGFALGGGLELALACHIRVAAEHAQLGFPESAIGLIPGYGGTQRLTQLIGRGKALEMILTADRISAREAYEFGLVNYVVNQEQLLIEAEQIMLKILSRAPIAIASAIKAINASLKPGEDGYETEIHEFSHCLTTSDFIEGVTAFKEKRKPVFKGE